MIRRLPLVFVPQPEGGFTVTSPVLPELLTEGDTLEEAFANVRDALAAVLELYAEQGRRSRRRPSTRPRVGCFRFRLIGPFT
jgi:antitoxin HicB